MEDKQASLSDSLKWIRVYRQASTLELSPSILNYMKIELMQQLGEYLPAPEPANESSKIANKTQDNNSRAQVELELRKLIQSNADWQAIESRAWKVFHHTPTGKTGANLVEIAFLYGGLKEACKVLEQLLESQTKHVYEKIHPAVRAQILSVMWKQSSRGNVWLYLVNHQQASWLLSFEKLLLFIFLTEREEASLCWLFFRTNQTQIEQGIKEIGSQIGVTLYRVDFLAARQAVKLGRVEEASQLLKSIPPKAAEYKEGLRLMHSLDMHQDFFKTSPYYTRLTAARDWQAKIKLLANFLEQVKTEQPAAAQDLLALNALLAKPLEWLADEAPALTEFSKLLVRYADLCVTLPNLTRVFIDQTFIQKSPELDLALWRPLIEYQGNVKEFIPLAAIAKVHVFLATVNELGEHLVFSARWQLLQFDKDCAHKPRGFQPWSTVWEWLFGALESCANVSGFKKKRALALALACKDPLNLSSDEIEAYLKMTQTNPPLRALEDFRSFAVKRNSNELELLTILKAKCSEQHYTNQELKRLWYLSVSRNKSDLAWRTISVLHNRTTIPKPIELAWDICGENKKHYPCNIPEAKQVDQCLFGFKREEVRLIWACVKLGVQIPILLAQTDKTIQINKFSFGHFRLKESSLVTQALDSIKWFATPKKDYHFVGQSGSKGFTTPAFAEIVLANQWNQLVAIICHRMGMSSWKWRLSHLDQAVAELKPGPAQGWQPFPKEHSIGKWVKSLEPEQKTAWQDLAHLSQKMSDEQGFRALSCFVVRLATLIHPSHHLAIHSLKKMRAPVYLIWDLEAWILSEQYSELRESKQWEHGVGIPLSLQKNPILK